MLPWSYPDYEDPAAFTVWSNHSPHTSGPLVSWPHLLQNEGSISTTLLLMAEQTNGRTYSQVAARKWLTRQLSPGMLRSRPNICRGPTLPQQAAGRDLLTRCRHMTGTLGRGGRPQSRLVRRVQEAHRYESHLVFFCPDVNLCLCGSWPLPLGSPGGGRRTFQGPCRAACALCIHGRCHMSTLYYLGSWREEPCCRSQRSRSILRTH